MGILFSSYLAISLSLVIIRYFHVCCIACVKGENDAVLVIDANAVLPLIVALQGFQVIARRGLEVLQNLRAVQIVELPDSCLEQRCGKSLALSRNVESFGFFIGKVDDHKALYNTQRYTVKLYL